ncbi:unnamed protein product [Prorocentrum cordatum]|uniref:Uncharacterized protein n=1 Tax=Prorocentrum cordatum TaxID=2364126 RepID=A0ABN9XIL9_9DINO|nr:unnamed protein product [Polarella glacialis]
MICLIKSEAEESFIITSSSNPLPRLAPLSDAHFNVPFYAYDEVDWMSTNMHIALIGRRPLLLSSTCGFFSSGFDDLVGSPETQQLHLHGSLALGSLYFPPTPSHRRMFDPLFCHGASPEHVRT